MKIIVCLTDAGAEARTIRHLWRDKLIRVIIQCLSYSFGLCVSFGVEIAEEL